jgi:lantibiotic modifying enzyme
MAIFFAALWVATEKPQWRERAETIFEEWLLDCHAEEFQKAAASLPVGAASGLASLAYACWVCARLFQRPWLLETSADLARLITRDMLAHDNHLDIFSGAAGAVLVFSLLAEDPNAADIFREQAIAAAERLLTTAIDVPRWEGVTWEAGGERYLGYGHGTAGIAAALSRVAALTGDDRFAAMARRAFNLVANLYSEVQGGWPHLLRGDEPVFQQMESLCHGTPGLALAFGEGVRAGIISDRASIARARHRIERLAAHPIDTVCCGNAGRLEALLAIGVSVEFASALIWTVFKRREPLGLFRTALRRSDIYVCQPGFFRGISGIGYTLLRLGEAHIFPAVAAWR